MDAGLSLVIPAYNEAATIRQAIQEADEVLDALFRRYEILVVDDGSSDVTASIAAELFPTVRVVRHAVNRGYGAALRSGFRAARFDLVAFTDADCQFDLRDLGYMTPLTAETPIVVGYRAERQDPWLRRFLSWGYNRLARTLLGTGVRDCDCALKVFRREVLADLLPESRGFFVNAEMLSRARRLGYAVTEVPVIHRPRLAGESKVSLREIPRTLRTMLRYWWASGRARPGRTLAARVTAPARAVPSPAPAPPLSS
jgi:dolichol-phosphate mannosyltransferase